ncbi:UspA domain protein [Dethiosulfovibrio peptidovorans DSM 11002]|uniref:UspA domain protein n=1 Tax=Dethiosulfovibrio peptidovorans DSM 11002 TaxID=469381 RepID=D2Z881_9BACT|nr:universal stress protein [Dethiosulfovibrio peptidovorans]EFC91678.1 UspA domain protein [Dethiosulfovibrio peptidovorans DSM 11002]
MFRKILYPSDLSERSERDLKWVATHLTERSEEIVAVHVVSTSIGVETPSVVSGAQEILKEMCERSIPNGVPFRFYVEAGEKDEVFSAIVRREDCSVAVITVSPDTAIVPLVQSLGLPQLILRWNTPPTIPGDILKNVVVATDLEAKRTQNILDGVKKVLDRRQKDTRITLLHGVPMEDASMAHGLFNQASKAMEAAKEEVEKWNDLVETKLVGGQTEEELPKAIVDLSTSLLVLGLPLKTDIWQLILGNTAEALVERTRCPILIIPTE